MIFFVGDAPILSASFKNQENSEPANPTTVRFFVTKISPPGGSTTQYVAPDVVNVDLGEYELALPILTEVNVGIWKYAATGIGAVEAGSNDGRFEVRPTLVPRT